MYGDEVIENVKILYTSCPDIVLECMFSDEIDNVVDEYKQIHDNLIGNMAFMYTGSLDEIKRLFEDHSLEYNTSNSEQFENERNDIKINNPFTIQWIRNNPKELKYIKENYCLVGVRRKNILKKYFNYPLEAGLLKLVDYTDGISTTDIMLRCHKAVSEELAEKKYLR